MDKQQSGQEEYTRRDSKDNADTALPLDEEIRVPAIWVFEAFTPTVIKNLHSSMESLGWHQSDLMFNADVPKRINDMRSALPGGGWLNLGHIISTNAAPNIFQHRRAPLPNGIESISASLFLPFASTTILCCQFSLTDEFAKSLEQPIRDQYKTYKEPTGRKSYRIFNVETQKRQAVSVMREYLVSVCCEWIMEYFPGYFSQQGKHSLLPACELIHVKQFDQFPVSRREALKPNYLGMLDLVNLYPLLKCRDIDNLYFHINDSWRGAENRAVIFGNINKILSSKDLSVYGSAKEEQVVNWLTYLDRTLGTWVVSLVARQMISEFAAIRDFYGELALSRANLNAEKVWALDRRLSGIQCDATPFAYELQRHCEAKALFLHDVFEFESVDEDPKHQIKLFHGLMSILKASAKHILEVDEQLRRTSSQAGQITTAISNEKLATTNLRLQKRMLWMTVVMLILAGLTAKKQLVDLWVWMQSKIVP